MGSRPPTGIGILFSFGTEAHHRIEHERAMRTQPLAPGLTRYGH